MNIANDKVVTIGDRSFRLFLSEQQILTAVRAIATEINNQYIGRRPILVPVLNGSFMFAADLMKELKCDCEISFIKTASYQGTQSGELQMLMGLNGDVTGRDVIILEDIVDTGNTLSKLIPLTKAHNPSSVKVASLLFKPDALKIEVQIDFIGIRIPNEFIVGYGLDYNGLGRNLRDIYQVI
jgi:hypoxanthine phosphoribosyltransferase